jgi:hypothetical protein
MGGVVIDSAVRGEDGRCTWYHIISHPRSVSKTAMVSTALSSSGREPGVECSGDSAR